MKDGFVRVACITPVIETANCALNAQRICESAQEAFAQGAKVLVYPELVVTASTCGDLFFQQSLLTGAAAALDAILKNTAHLDAVLVVGLPILRGTQLYNCAAVLLHGRILGFIPKMRSNCRQFADGAYIMDEQITICGQDVPFGTDLTFAHETLQDFVFGVQIGSDAFLPSAALTEMAQAGANLIVNPCAEPEFVGAAQYRRRFLGAQSALLNCAYAFCGAGQGESTQDFVFAGHSLIYENGQMLAQSQRFGAQTIFADVDLSIMAAARRKSGCFDSSVPMRRIEMDLEVSDLKLLREIDPLPFIPSDPDELSERCEEVLSIQCAGLAQRLKHIHGKSAVLGLSGGLDSTLALIVTARVFDQLGLDRSGITAVSMPCFGTTGRTRNNAQYLAQAYGVTFREIPIADSVRSHFKDIGHDESVHNVTYENAQARERTQVLMDIANQTGGIVIGTGDLSELALGWATYNGDHMSMYGVNASVPKMLVRHLVAHVAKNSEKTLSDVLLDVLETPVSPELLPPVEGQIAQKTEQLVGPYELHDFFLYYLVRWGFAPKKIFRLAKAAFADKYPDETIAYWLKTFLRRFFNQQFKRSCLPDGPAVGTVSLSPRGSFAMPSDAVSALWLEEAEHLI